MVSNLYTNIYYSSVVGGGGTGRRKRNLNLNVNLSTTNSNIAGKTILNLLDIHPEVLFSMCFIFIVFTNIFSLFHFRSTRSKETIRKYVPTYRRLRWIANCLLSQREKLCKWRFGM